MVLDPNANQSDHRQLLIKRHEQISSGSVAAGFVHPTHLYRRDADALPLPDKAFNLTVTQGLISPDGFERLGFLMNGKYPADPFVWDENDDIEITVNNQGPVPFAIHWHGIHQIGTPDMDGVPGLSQWNVYPGQSYTYRFKLINQYGGYWYHSHERGYYADGLRGTIYIRPKPDRKKPWYLISANLDDIDQMEAAEKNFQVMALSDHWHINHTDMLLVVHETGVPPACFDSLLINGRGRQYCPYDWTTVMSPIELSLLQNFSSTNPDGITSKGCISLVPAKAGYTVKGTLDTRYGGVCQNTTAPLTVFSAAKAIKEGRRWLNLQIIDTATNWYYGVSIDGHKMWIVAVDGHYIEPMQVDWAQITIGSRLSVMVELNPNWEGYVFPIRLTGARALQPIEGHAFLSYVDDIDRSWNPDLEEDFDYAMRTLTTAHVPMSGFITDTSVVKWQQNLSAPFDPISPAPKTSTMTLHAVASQNSLNVWQLASTPLDTVHLADERPMLFNATDDNATSNQMTPYATIPFGTVVDIIMENNIYSIVGGPNSPHPFHMHSRRFWILGSGAGPFPADTVAEAQAQGVVFNLETPPLRDGFDIDANSWVVIRYVVDHAAANIIHCHIDDHAIEGMAAVLLEGLETIPAGGNFSEAIKAKPASFVETQNDELGQVLEQSWATGSADAKYIEPAVTDTVNPWGDPRSLANSIQLLASSNSVQKSITSSLLLEMSSIQATAIGTVTAIVATVSDSLTTFTGVAATTDAAATAAATATIVSATATAVVSATATADDTAESTIIAAAYTTNHLVPSSARATGIAAPTSFATTYVTVAPTALATSVRSAVPVDTVYETEVAGAAYSTLYDTDFGPDTATTFGTGDYDFTYVAAASTYGTRDYPVESTYVAAASTRKLSSVPGRVGYTTRGGSSYTTQMTIMPTSASHTTQMTVMPSAAIDNAPSAVDAPASAGAPAPANTPAPATAITAELQPAGTPAPAPETASSLAPATDPAPASAPVTASPPAGPTATLEADPSPLTTADRAATSPAIASEAASSAYRAASTYDDTSFATGYRATSATLAVSLTSYAASNAASRETAYPVSSGGSTSYDDDEDDEPYETYLSY